MSASGFDGDSLRSYLIERVAGKVGVPPSAIDPDEPFSSYGLNSVKLAAIAGELQAELGEPLDPTILFEYPSISSLAAYLTSGARPIRSRERPSERDAIAITGIACHMPGASDAEAFWQALVSGVDAIREVPDNRWDWKAVYDPDPAALGCTVSKWGGFVDGITGFDARFFRISSDEAARMDPQQRLLLETCWEALEDAGEVPAKLRGQRVGVYIGISANEYATRQLQNRTAIGPYTATGNSLAVAANRLSYFFDFRGPSVAIDTACSSSLVAIHLACAAISAGDCDRALVGGINLLLDPEVTIGLSKAGMLAPDGRCKPFDAAANGYVRAEGCGVVMLRPLAAALASEDRIYAVVRGSAINQDGSSNGLTAPNPAAQRDVVHAACRSAGVEPSAIQYVECHGTGTFLGDPVEARSLGAVVGLGRPADAPCLVGSVKSNIGHLEAAAGIAGVIKVALSLHKRQLPQSLHFSEPNPHIPFPELGLQVVTRTMEWPRPGEARLAGVSSFGFGGANAHLILGAAPEPVAALAYRGPVALPISAPSRFGLDQMVRSWASRLTAASADEVTALVYTASSRRTHHRSFRLAIAASDPLDLAARVRAVAQDPALIAGLETTPSTPPRVGFVFSGQGAQWAGMARELLDADPLFTSMIRRCDRLIAAELGWSIEAVLRGQDERNLDASEVAQPLLVAIQLSLAHAWQAVGIEPVAVVGHSLGEVSAAVTAGLLDLEAGLRLAARRGRLMGAASQGRMLAVGLSRDDAERIAIQYPAEVAVAAVNGPRTTVLSGEAAALDRILEDLTGRGVRAHWLAVEYAFHSRQMDGASAAFTAELGDLAGRKPALPFYSTVLGRKLEEGEMNAEYWGRGISDPVEFAAAVSALIKDGVDVLIEVGPQPVLRGHIRELAAAAGHPEVAVLHSIDRNQNDRRVLLDGLCRLYALGSPVRWEYFFPEGGRMVSPPQHAWERERYWIERYQNGRPHSGPAAQALLGERIAIAVADGRLIWEAMLSTETLPALADHRISGAVLLPGSAYLELALAAAAGAGINGAVDVRDLVLHKALTLDKSPVAVQTTLAPQSGGYTVSVHSLPASGKAWKLHATALIVANSNERPGPVDLADAELRCQESIAPSLFYELLATLGFEYGPAFQGLEEIKRSDGEAIAIVTSAKDPASPGTSRLRMLDAAFQLIAAAAGLRADSSSQSRLAIPSAVEKVCWWSPPAANARAHVRVKTIDLTRLVADVTILDQDARPCVEVLGLELRYRASAGQAPASADPSVRFYETQWREKILEPAVSRPGRWLVLAGQSHIGPDLIAELKRRGVAGVLCKPGGSFRRISPDSFQIDPWEPADYQLIVDELTRDAEPFAGAVHLWALDGARSPDAVLDSGATAFPATTLLYTIRALSFCAGGSAPKLIAATRGCQAAGRDGGQVFDPIQATLWGLLKTLPLENPLLPFACIDLSGEDDESINSLCDELLTDGPDLEIAYRQRTRFVRRLVEVSGSHASHKREVIEVRAGATYVITGGTGALGLRIAQALVERGAEHIALLARHPERARANPAFAELQRRAGIQLISADVRDRTEMARVLSSIRASGRPIRGVIHAAGVLADGALLDMTAEGLRTVLEPKVLGGWNLHELTLGDALDWFVLFSSAAGVLGSPGQANYSAANACLDALAHYRRGLGLPAVSIDWGPWAGAGLAADGVNNGDHRLRTAASAIDPTEGVAIFERLVREHRTQTVVLPFDLRNLLQFYPSGRGMGFFDQIATEELSALKSITVRVTARPDLANGYVAPRNRVEQRIASIWQKSLGIEPVGVLDSFFELGGDSVFANQILVEINRALGVTINPQRAFENLSVAHLAALAEEETIARLSQMTETEAARLMDQQKLQPAVS